MSVLIEYNDWQMRVYDAAGTAVYSDIAAALHTDGQLEFGEHAWHHSRSQPQRFNNRYLANLNADPINGDLGPAKNHADLIYHHLRTLPVEQGESTVLAVPGYFSNNQLGVLMGICQEVGLQISGFVDMALAYALPCLQNAAASAALQSGAFHLLDLEQHRVSLSEVRLAEGSLVAQNHRTFNGIGLLNLLDGWMNLVADDFVQKTRFDPTHTGACEQQMLDQIYAWFATATIQPRINIEHNGTNREIEVNVKDLLDKQRQRLGGLELAGVEVLAVTTRAQMVPGLIEYLEQQVPQVLRLDESAVPGSYQQLAAQLQPGSVSRVQRIAADARIPEPAAPAEPQPVPTQAVTHLLHAHTAYATTDARFSHLQAQVRQLRGGDTIDIDGVSYLAITVT